MARTPSGTRGPPATASATTGTDATAGAGAPASASPANRVACGLFAGLAPRYDRLAAVLSFGQHPRWHRALVERIAPSCPRRVLDVATGTAPVALALAGRTDAHVVGVDLSEPMLREGARRVGAAAPARVALVVGRAEALPFPDGHFDALTFTYLLRYVDDPAATLRELARVVAPRGVVAGLDFEVPARAGWRAAWWAYTRAVLPVAGLAGGRPWARVGRFLGPSISGFAASHSLHQVLRWWHEAGIGDVATRTMSLGGARITWGRRADG